MWLRCCQPPPPPPPSEDSTSESTALVADEKRRPVQARAYLQVLGWGMLGKLGIKGCVQRPSRAAATNKPEIKPDELISVPGATSAERHRYLVSKKGDRAAAAKSLRAHLEWRRTSLPVPEERAPVPEWIYQYGTARDGTPVIMCHPQRYSVEVPSAPPPAPAHAPGS